MSSSKIRLTDSILARFSAIGLLASALSACGTGVSPQTASQAAAQARAGLVQRAGGAGRLLYVANYGANPVSFYSYKTGKLGGTLSGTSGAQGTCSDVAGNVWVANTNASTVAEYAHGATSATQTLQDAGENPSSCAVSYKNVLAVGNICSSPSCGQGNIVFYKAEGGSAIPATCPNLYRFYFVGFDKKGNLYADGENSSFAFAFCEIAAGSTTGKAITLDHSVGFPGGVAWDGTAVAIQDQDTSTIGRYAISGTTGTLNGTVTLGGAGVPFFIESKSRALAPVTQGIGFFKYPAGGDALKTLPLSCNPSCEESGLTVSPLPVL